MWNQDFESEIGAELNGLTLSSSNLQINSSNEDGELRKPTCHVVLPRHNVIFVGFDNGEVQTYFSNEDLDSNEAKFEAGAGFKTGGSQPFLFLKQFPNWNPFPDDDSSTDKKSSVVYGGCEGADCLFMYWILDNDVQLTWIKYKMPLMGSYQLTDACLCPGMGKLVAGTNRGRLLLFDAIIRGQIVESNLPIKEHVETKLIVKVVHEGGVTCVTSNESGFLILSGGKDGKICICQWAHDHFPHEVGFLYLTNLPVQKIITQTFPQPRSKTDPSEIWLAVDSYILNLRVWTRTSQLYMMEQQPRKNIKMSPGTKPLLSPNSMVLLDDDEKENVAFVSQTQPGKCQFVRLGGKSEDILILNDFQVLCFDFQACSGKHSRIASFAITTGASNEPTIRFWKK